MKNIKQLKNIKQTKNIKQIENKKQTKNIKQIENIKQIKNIKQTKNKKQIQKIQQIKYTDKRYPETLKKIKNPPQKLYVIGDATLLNKQSIAIVGSRKASEYGKKYTALFSNNIANSNIAVVSGLALGIDSMAHKYSMEEQGKTIAVIASGFEHIYPNENIPLYQEIIKNGGCIVSEYPPETKIDMKLFPKRNRIIAGLSMAVIVIEAKYRSGSSITAKYALEQKKQVFCLPHSIEDKNGVGCNNLIKKGAKLIAKASELNKYLGTKIEDSNIEEVLTEGRITSPNIIKNQISLKPKVKKEKIQTTIEKEYQPIYNLLLKKVMTNNEIAKKLEWPISQVNQMLTMMEIKGYITSMAGNEFKIKE